MRKPISQREARRLRAELQEARDTIIKIKSGQYAWNAPYAGVHIVTLVPTAEACAAINTATKLSHDVVVRKGSTEGQLALWAVPRS